MPNTDSPKVTMDDEEFVPPVFARRSGASAGSRWFCPNDQIVAAYVDGTLEARKAKFESHLAKCERCRNAVADVVKLQREGDRSVPPSKVIHRARQLAPANGWAIKWAWVPVGACVVVAAIIAVVLVREPASMWLPSPSAPTAPKIAKSIPPVTPRMPVQDISRKPATTELMPAVISPRLHGSIDPATLVFRWHQIPKARSYSVHLVTSEGDPVWEGQTERTSLPLPPQVALKKGRYFVWIGVDLEDSRTAKSAPVAFEVKD